MKVEVYKAGDHVYLMRVSGSAVLPDDWGVTSLNFTVPASLLGVSKITDGKAIAVWNVSDSIVTGGVIVDRMSTLSDPLPANQCGGLSAYYGTVSTSSSDHPNEAIRMEVRFRGTTYHPLVIFEPCYVVFILS